MPFTGWYRKQIQRFSFCSVRLLCLAMCLLLMASCKYKPKKKEDHLPRELMQKALLDVNIAEAYSTLVKDSTYNKTVGKNFDSLAVYYKSILAHHKISAEAFSNSLNWYKQNPDEMDSIYVKMIPVAEKITVAPAEKK
jgi:hypothetical protein